MKILISAILVSFLAHGLSGQTAPALAKFEAVSIRPSNFVIGNMRITMTGGPGSSDPGRVTFVNYVLSDLITKAYSVDLQQMSGADWLLNPGTNSPRFDIIAKITAGATKEEFQVMLQNMLAERFRMTAHREQKEAPVYNLIVAKNGPKLVRSLKEALPPTPSSLGMSADGFPLLPPDTDMQVFNKTGGARMQAVNVSMETLAQRLSLRSGVDRHVRNATRLDGRFNFVLSWQAHEAPPDVDTLPWLFDALQNQLGLKLESAKGEVETFVIDRIEKTPTDN